MADIKRIPALADEKKIKSETTSFLQLGQTISGKNVQDKILEHYQNNPTKHETIE